MYVQVNLIEFEYTSTVHHADIRPKYALCGLYNVQFISEGMLISVGGVGGGDEGGRILITNQITSDILEYRPSLLQR